MQRTRLNLENKVPLRKVAQPPKAKKPTTNEERMEDDEATRQLERRRKHAQHISEGKVTAKLAALYEQDPSYINGTVLATDQICRMFDVSVMTVYNWRKRRKLPFYHLEGGAKPPVRYDEGMVLQWAKANGMSVKNSDYIKLPA